MRLKIQTKKGPNLNEKTDPIRTQNQAFLRKNRPRKSTNKSLTPD
jgi:hypothetical protein